jgi:FkbM family methyltransferase
MKDKIRGAIDTFSYLTRKSGCRYKFQDRFSLFRARLSHRHETALLDFRVQYLDRASFQIAMREVFLDGVYRFNAKTDAPSILDCGANIGLATLFFKWSYPRARVVAFEADPNTAAVLRKNVTQNRLQDVVVHNLALADHEGELKFYVTDDVAGSLKGSVDSARVPKGREIVIEAGKLSNFIEGPIDLMKLDVEGSEWEVLADLRQSGKISLIQKMVIEYHHKIGGQASRLAEFLAQVEEAGFEYQIAADCNPITGEGINQDILIGAYRQDSSIR